MATTGNGQSDLGIRKCPQRHRLFAQPATGDAVKVVVVETLAAAAAR
jgi:hypothetical protein